jgi:hypothetical protein
MVVAVDRVKSGREDQHLELILDPVVGENTPDALKVALADRQRERPWWRRCPVVNGRRWIQALRTTDLWLELLDKIDEDRRRRFRTGESARAPVTGLASQGVFCAMPADAKILAFLEEAKKNLKTWRPDLAMESIEKIIELNPEAVLSPHTIAVSPLGKVGAAAASSRPWFECCRSDIGRLNVSLDV